MEAVVVLNFFFLIFNSKLLKKKKVPIIPSKHVLKDFGSFWAEGEKKGYAIGDLDLK